MNYDRRKSVVDIRQLRYSKHQHQLNVEDDTDADHEEYQTAEDMVDIDLDLNNVLEASIIDNLTQRFRNGQYYTDLGYDTLISVNPYVDQSHLYDKAYKEAYIQSDIGHLPPHPYEIIEKMVSEMERNQIDQTLLISGESSSGKSFIIEQLLDYISYKFNDLHLLHSLTILQWFTKAQSLLNNHASRISYSITIELAQDDFSLVKSQIRLGHIERNRVSSKPKNESNYLVFYHLLDWIDKNRLTEQYGLLSTDFEQYDILKDSKISQLDIQKQDVDSLFKSMEYIGMDSRWIDILISILHLGNISVKQFSSDNSVYSLHFASTLLQMDTQELASYILRGERFKDGLIDYLYQYLLRLIVQKINFKNDFRLKAKTLKLKLFDFPGFEVYQKNNDNQLISNFINEHVHYLNNHCFFLKKEEAMHEDGVISYKSSFFDNQTCVELLKDEENGLLKYIDQSLNSQSKQNIKDEMNRRYYSNQSYIPETLKNYFTVKHFATDASYNFDKQQGINLCQIRRDARFVLLKSQSVIVNSITHDTNTESHIQQSLNFAQEISKSCQNSHVWFIKCYKINHFQDPLSLDLDFFCSQIAYTGLEDILYQKLRGFPYQLSYLEFFRLYDFIQYDKKSALARSQKGKNLYKTLTDLQPKCLNVITYALNKCNQFFKEVEQQLKLIKLQANYPDSKYQAFQIGYQNIWLSTRLKQMLDTFVDHRRDYWATLIQKTWRGYYYSKQFKLLIHDIKATKAEIITPNSTMSSGFHTILSNDIIKNKKVIKRLGTIDSYSTVKISDSITDISNSRQLKVYGRKFFCKGSVWEVINANLVKERELFLFNDILVIAKQSDSDDQSFVFKTLLDISYFGLRKDRNLDPMNSSALSKTIKKARSKFEVNPKNSLTYLIDKGVLQPSSSSVAEFLFYAQGFDRHQLGKFLTHIDNKEILDKFVAYFPFDGLRIDEALRYFFKAVRPPGIPQSMDLLLEYFTKYYFKTNQNLYKSETALLKIVFAILLMNAEIHKSSKEQHAGSKVSKRHFIKTVKQYDTHNDLSKEQLGQIYKSISESKISLVSEQSYTSNLYKFDASTIPYRCFLEDEDLKISVSLPHRDKQLKLKVICSDGLKAQPDILTFKHSQIASSQLVGKKTGKQSLSILIIEGQAQNYDSKSLPINQKVIVEPLFMKHTFQLVQTEKQEPSKKVSFMFSVANEHQKKVWERQINSMLNALDGGVVDNVGISLESEQGEDILDQLQVEGEVKIYPKQNQIRFDE